MAVEEMFTQLPTVANAQLTDIICAVQGYNPPSNNGLSVQETLQQVYSLFQSNIILFSSGNPNGTVAGTTYQFCWDIVNQTLYICTFTGTAGTAVWVRADINDGYTTTATAAGTTTLTILSTYWQYFTGTTTQTVVMPVANTLAAGMTWEFVNNSTGAVTIQSSGLNTITTLAAGESAKITCILNSGTSAASWNAIDTSFPLPLPAANGAIPIGNGTNYTVATLTAGPGISIVNGSGSVTISGTASSIGWNTVTSATNMVAENGYIVNNSTSSPIVLTLPTTAVVGTSLAIIGTGSGSGGWSVTQGSGQSIQVGTSSSTTGPTGHIASTNRFDNIYLVCIVANTTWSVLGGPQGSITVT